MLPRLPRVWPSPWRSPTAREMARLRLWQAIASSQEDAPGGPPMQPTDEPLDVQITKALGRDQRTAKVAIDVTCLGGRVTLIGIVGSAATKAAVTEVVRSVP